MELRLPELPAPNRAVVFATNLPALTPPNTCTQTRAFTPAHVHPPFTPVHAHHRVFAPSFAPSFIPTFTPSCALTIARLPHRAHPRSHPGSPPSCTPTIARSPPRANPHSPPRSPPRTKIELHLEEPDSGIIVTLVLRKGGCTEVRPHFVRKCDSKCGNVKLFLYVGMNVTVNVSANDGVNKGTNEGSNEGARVRTRNKATF